MINRQAEGDIPKYNTIYYKFEIHLVLETVELQLLFYLQSSHNLLLVIARCFLFKCSNPKVFKYMVNLPS